MNTLTEPHVPSPPLRALLALCALAVVSQLYWPLPVLPQVARAYGLAPGAAGAVVSAFGMAYAMGFLLFGPLSDRLGRRAVMAWGLAGRALQGLAAAAFAPAAIAYLAERGTPRQRTWGVAWISTAFLSAGLLGQIHGGAVAGRWGLGTALLPLAAVYAVTAWALWRTPADVRTAARALPSPRASIQAMGTLLADARLRRAYGPALLLLPCFVAFYLLLDLHAGAALRAQGITPLAARAVALPAFLAPLAVAAAMPRTGAARFVALGLGMAAIGLLLAAWAGTAHLHGLLAASVVFVLGVGTSVPSLIARVAGLAATPVRGLAVALYTFVLFVGASLGPWLAHATARWPPGQALGLLAALLGAAALYAATPVSSTPGDHA